MTKTPTPALPSDVKELREAWTITPFRDGFNIHEGKQLVGWFADRALAQQIVDENNGVTPRASTPTDKEAGDVLDRLDLIEARINATDGGDWVLVDPEDDRLYIEGESDVETDNEDRPRVFAPKICEIEDRDGQEANADFIANSKADVRWLISQLRTAISRARSASVTDAETDLRNFRARVFTCRQVDGCDHNTACTIWGDDGFGGTKEGFKEPLPCNCGALTNYAKKPTPPAHGEGELRSDNWLFDTGPANSAKGPRILDACYTAFNSAKSPNKEDGGASDWFNDTYPNIVKLIEGMKRRALSHAPSPPQQDGSGLVEALRPFADIAAHEELQPRFADDEFTINLGLMNGNVTQSVIRDKLHASDFRRAAQALVSSKAGENPSIK